MVKYRKNTLCTVIKWKVFTCTAKLYDEWIIWINIGITPLKYKEEGNYTPPPLWLEDIMFLPVCLYVHYEVSHHSSETWLICSCAIHVPWFYPLIFCGSFAPLNLKPFAIWERHVFASKLLVTWYRYHSICVYW